MFLALIRTMTECGGGVLRLSEPPATYPPATLREKEEDSASFQLFTPGGRFPP